VSFKKKKLRSLGTTGLTEFVTAIGYGGLKKIKTRNSNGAVGGGKQESKGCPEAEEKKCPVRMEDTSGG